MSLKKQAVSGVFWTFTQQFSMQVINFGVQIILARLLMPEVFGLVAMLTVFVSIGQTLMDGGMTSSLIRTKNPDQLDYSTVFLTNLMVSIAIYLIIFLAAPAIASFYDQEILKNLLRVYALTFVIRSLVAVHTAKLTKEMNFKTQMKLQVPSTIVGGVVGVSMALGGFGVWSLVWLSLSQAIVFTIQNWIFIRWRPSIVFNKRRFKYHLNFGYKLTLSGLLDTIYNNAYRIVIGKFFSPSSVGFFNQAETMRLFPVEQISIVMDKVTYPLFSNIKSDIQLKSAYRSTMQLALFVVTPIMLILILVATDFFVFVFGEKWLPSVPYFQILAIASIVRPISSYNLNLLKVKGRSDLFLKLEVVKKIIGIAVIAIALPFGIMALVVSLTVISYFFTAINMFFSGKLINYSIGEQLKDVSKILLIGLSVGTISYFIYNFLDNIVQSHLLMILAIGLIYTMIYLIAIVVFDRKIIQLIKNLIR